MKRILMVALLSILSAGVAMACPFCGCGGGNLYMGLLPNFQEGFVGVRYHYDQYHTQLVSDQSQYSDNYYNTLELWGGLRLGKKIQLLAFVPYYQNKQIDDDGTSHHSGLGDITVMAQYRVFDIAAIPRKKVWEHQLWIGGGIKAPTGSFDIDVNDPSTTVADINAQLGTGSIDFIANAMYSISVGNWGLNTSLSYKINTANDDHYKYGNKLNGNMIAYHRFTTKHGFTISPNAGFGYEKVAINKLMSEVVQYTGSNVTTAIAGFEFNYKKIGFGLNGQLPIHQNYAEGQTSLKFKGMMHVTFAL